MWLAQLGKLNKILPIITIYIFLSGIIGLQSQQYKKLVHQINNPNYLQQEQAQKKVIKFQKHTPTLGFDNLVANWSYLSFVQYFGDKSARETIGYSLVPDYFEAVSDRDPQFVRAYLTLAIANSMYAGNPELTVVLIDRILKSASPKTIPNISLLWSSKGLDELLYLGDIKAAQNSYKMAAYWADRQGSNLEKSKSAKNLNTALFLSTEPDIKQAQILAWSAVLPNVKDFRRRQEIIDKINSLKAEIAVSKAKPQPASNTQQ